MFNCNTEWYICIWLYSFWFTNDDYILPGLNVNPDTITASGFSSGSFMTTNVHFIHSNLIKGVGLIAGGMYGNHLDDDSCDRDTIRNITLKFAQDNENNGLIDSLENMEGAPIYI